MSYVLQRKKYYKYDDVNWTQPVLTSNGTWSGSSFATTQNAYFTENDGRKQEAWRMFSSSNTEEWQINDVSTSKTYWASWYNPKPLKITKLQVVNASGVNGQYSPAKLVLEGSNDDSSWTSLGTTNNSNTTALATWDATISSTGWYKYYRIVVTPRVGTAMMINKLTITALQRNGVKEGTASDYSYTENKIYALKANGKSYLLNRNKENVIYDSWVQPNLTANGNLGETSFAVSATKANSSHPAYHAVDGNSGTFWQVEGNATGNSFTFYSPAKLKVSSLVFTFYNNTEEYAMRSGVLYGSNDNKTWTQIKSFSSYTTTWDVSSNTNAYKYHKISITKGGSYNDYVDLVNLKINATALIEK